MSFTAFSNPVPVTVGIGFRKEIKSLQEAIRYLDEVPVLLRDEIYHATRDACLDALCCEGSVEEANDVFAAFVMRRGGLMADPRISVNAALRDLPLSA